MSFARVPAYCSRIISCENRHPPRIASRTFGIMLYLAISPTTIRLSGRTTRTLSESLTYLVSRMAGT